MFDTPEFQALRREYLQGAALRVGHLKEQADLLRTGGLDSLASLRQEIHKLRGSGGFYGFSELSAAAGRAEDTIILILDGELDRDDELVASLVDQLVQAVDQAVARTGI